MKQPRVYLHEVDFMRVFFIFGVVLVHTISQYDDQFQGRSGLFLNEIYGSLHFTRLGFMFMTGMVLFLNYYHRPIRLWSFWRKRYVGVGIPYIFWITVYLLITLFQGNLSAASFGPTWLTTVIHGSDFFMYYVLVTFQLYLVFPVIVWLLKRTEKHHGLVLTVSFLVQLAVAFSIKYWLPHVDTSHWPFLLRSYGSFLGTYQFYFLAGGLLSIHYKSVIAFVKQHERPILISTVVFIPIIWLYYYLDYNVFRLNISASSFMHQPLMVVYSSLIILSVLLLGLHYANYQHRHPHSLPARFVALGAKLSFGIYLTQTLALWFWPSILPMMPNTKTYFIALPIYNLIIFSTAFIISYLLYKLPWTGRLIGRPRRHTNSGKAGFAHEKLNFLTQRFNFKSSSAETEPQPRQRSR
ncbi:acyltransferase family protein [Furfurilactobacillus milii]|uniref:Acyltransferase family protein n=1 Tax=Furfurilactobacillus rossiae TaxID=231049 RepID=A0A7C9N3P4_9LACO|nr:acyltransferase family protein [Furfurilactobacillus milii]